MRQWLWLPLLLYVCGLVGMLSFESTDVAQLKPVEVVCVEVKENTVCIRTDTEHCGFGQNLHTAIEDLKASTPGYIFLETAEYILLGEAALSITEELESYLRPGCSVCMIKEEIPLQEVSAFLRVHKPSMTLQQLHTSGGVPERLQLVGGRLYLGTAKINNETTEYMDSDCDGSAFIASCGNVKLV